MAILIQYILNHLLILGIISKLYVVCDLQPECIVNTGYCTYKFSLTDKPECPNENGNPNPFSEHMRFKRSMDVTYSQTEKENPEIRKIQKKIGKLEKRLTNSMDSLSSRVLRGVRRMEEKVSDLMTSHQKRNINYHGNQEVCPNGFIKVDNWPFCYLLSRFNTTWFEAKDFCAALESDLVALGTVKEHYLLTFLIKNDPDFKEATGWWTSGTFVEKTRQWMWTAALYLKPFTFIKWATNEPNEETSQCVYINRHDDHLWHDDLCTNRFNFICETMARSV